MSAVFRDAAWTGWCAFFLQGLIERASENKAKAQAIIDLNALMLRKVAELTHSQFSAIAVDFIFSRPIVLNDLFCGRHQHSSRDGS